MGGGGGGSPPAGSSEAPRLSPTVPFLICILNKKKDICVRTTYMLPWCEATYLKPVHFQLENWWFWSFFYIYFDAEHTDL